MRTVTVNNRTWSADEEPDGEVDRRRDDDPVAAAGVNYGYARL